MVNIIFIIVWFCRICECPNRTRKKEEITRCEPNQPVPNSRKGNVEKPWVLCSTILSYKKVLYCKLLVNCILSINREKRRLKE